MTKTRFTVLDAFTALTVVGLIAIAIGVQVAGPTDAIPMHFDIHGQPDRWGDRSELSGLIAFMAFMAAITAGPMSWYAKRAPDAARRRGLEIGQLVSLLAIVGTSAFMIWMILGRGASQTGVSLTMSAALMSLLFAVMGAFMGRVAPNPIVGVRTPWAYKSRLAWDRSNRLAGRLFFWLGLLGLITAPLTPQPLGFTLLIVGVLIAAGWSVFESWRVWRADPDRQPF
ncbi:SdpI family protein [Brevundimonas sp. CEF1]|uniref:SdpI family protein n=1 Tax=Brevundimonas sp. CEF1 TaxID=3442642 RepID=UPI003F5194DD